MSKAGLHLIVVIPGLCGSGEPAFLKSLTEQFPALERLLSRSQHVLHAVDGLDASLYDHFGMPCPANSVVPVAALTSLVDVDAAEMDAAYLMRADPVHLRADQSALRLFDSRTFSISQEEADALTAAFNEFYADKGWCLKAPCPQRWYLGLPEAPQIKTVSPVKIAAQTIDPNLPHGRDAAEWHALMNEVQMLFHQHPVNRRREEREEPMINSLWFWGEGALPDEVLQPEFQVATDYPLAMGLAQFTGISRRDIAADANELLAAGDETPVLLVLDDLEAAAQYEDVEAWLAQLKNLEHSWFAPLLEAVGDGRVASLEIDPCNGKSYRTSRKQQRCFWKRPRPLADICQHG